MKKSRFAEPLKVLIEENPAFGYRTVAHLLDFNKNAVQRIFQLKGWQGKRRPIGFRPPVKALPLIAQAPNERWATDLCRIWAGRDQLGGTIVFLSNASMSKPLQPFDDNDNRSLMEDYCLTGVKRQRDVSHPPHKTERAVWVHVLFTLLMFAVAPPIEFLPVLAGWRFLISLAVLYLWVNSTGIAHSSLAFYCNLPSVALYALTLPFALINLERLWTRLRSRFPHVIPARTAVQTALCAILAVSIVWQVRPPLTLTRSPTLPIVFDRELRIHQFIAIHRALNSILADHHKCHNFRQTIAH